MNVVNGIIDVNRNNNKMYTKTTKKLKVPTDYKVKTSIKNKTGTQNV